MTSEEGIALFDESLRRIKIQYDLFFAGVRKLPPTEDKRRLDDLVREIGKSRLRDNALRFRYTTLVGRYNQFQELWNRQMREREEGPMDFRRRSAAMSAPPREPALPERPVIRETSETADSYVKVASSTNGDAMQQLYQQILEAQQRLGKAGAPTMEQVVATVQKQAESLRSKYGVDTIAFRVETVDGKVKLKAKPTQE
jgi:hypothetical protein